jgi:ABC-type glutathione transport system ATPase component
VLESSGGTMVMKNPEYIIKLENVTAGYLITPPGIRSLIKTRYIVLKNINLSVNKSERIAIVGSSGSGKTTLLKVILGLLKPFSGRVFIYEYDIYRLPWRERVKILKKIGYVPQDPFKSLNPMLRVKDILREPLEAHVIRGYKESKIESKVKSIVKLVGLPEKVLEMYPEELSGGMRQRVLIARALVSEPEVLILDEPTSALDVSVQAQIINLINDIYEQFKPAILLVTHDLSIAQYIADRIIVIENKEIVEEGLIDNVLSNPQSHFMKMAVSSYKDNKNKLKLEF